MADPAASPTSTSPAAATAIDLPGFADVRAAAARIAPFVRRTPVLHDEELDAAVGASVFFKCENLQRTGAFKLRGATNAVRALAAEEASRGVLTHSSGNHGAALALAARERGISCWVVMPANVPRAKRSAVEGYGGRVVECGPTLAAREEATARLREETGARLVHPYEDPAVIAGQGTAALELLEEVPGLDLLIAPLGGGGLLSGTALSAAALSPAAAVWGAEPSGADDGARSLAAGRIVPVEQPRTVADGLRATLGHRALALFTAHGVRIATVGEDAILAAMRLLWQRLRVVVEPSGAVPFAALRGGDIAVAGRRVGVILSGGNLDLPETLFAIGA